MLLQLITEGQWGFCWCMMSLTSHPSTVNFLMSTTNIFDFYIPALFWTCFLDLIADIRNWIRNIEQHASDNVNKILVGNKADMDESKRVQYITSEFHPFYNCLIHEVINSVFGDSFFFFQAVPKAKGQALADEYGIKFFETVSQTLSHENNLD